MSPLVPVYPPPGPRPRRQRPAPKGRRRTAILPAPAGAGAAVRAVGPQPIGRVPGGAGPGQPRMRGHASLVCPCPDYALCSFSFACDWRHWAVAAAAAVSVITLSVSSNPRRTLTLKPPSNQVPIRRARRPLVRTTGIGRLHNAGGRAASESHGADPRATPNVTWTL